MIVYLGIALALIASAWIAFGDPARERLLFYGWSAFFVFFIGLRRWVGCDFSGYILIWNDLRYMTFDEARARTEPGFALLVHIVQGLGFNYAALNVFAAVLFLFGWVAFSLRQPSPISVAALSFPVLIIHLAMSGIRQAVAVSFVMLAMVAFVERRRLAFGLLVALAAAFHYSAAVFLPLLLAMRRTPSVAMLGLSYAAAVVLVTVLDPGSLRVYQGRYLGAPAGEEAVAAGGPIRAAMVFAAGGLFLLVLAKPWKRVFPADYGLYRILALASLPLLPLAVVASVVGDRLGYYLMPAQLAIFARIPHLGAIGGGGKALAAAPYLGLLGFLAVWLTTSSIADACYLPYDNYLLEDQGTKYLPVH